MRAVTVGTGHELGWEEVPDPVRGDGEVLVDIHATAVNRADLLQRRGKYPPPPGAPAYMGLEMSGRVAEVGPGSRWQVGDPVCALLAGGGYAERVSVHEDLLLPVPGGLSLAEAASLPEVFSTAYLNLFLEAELAEGETLFVHAGASGVGIAATQLGRFAGAHVITTVGSAEKAKKARALGADHVINYREERFEGVVRKLTKKRGVDVVFEHTGVDTWAGSLFSLKRGGRLVTCGSTTGIMAEINLMQLFQQQYRIFGSFGCTVANLAESMAKMADGSVKPVIDAQITMETIEDGLARLEGRDVFGKIVMKL